MRLIEFSLTEEGAENSMREWNLDARVAERARPVWEPPLVQAELPTWC